MTNPLVSVCLPNLNTAPYLKARTDSILQQTYKNWELVISDNHSDDGAWEFFTGLARSEGRVFAEQAPKQGMYPNWNNCVRRSRGEYVYMATSDDTMAGDCLEKMVAALERNPECGFAHCPLVVIDEAGRVQEGSFWLDRSDFAAGLAGIQDKVHLRRAPYDGMLHLAGRIVYISMTQLLIRRSLFDRIGFFEGRWGSTGDFHWGMKASLVSDSVHVPGTWASWRMYPGQATASVDFSSEAHRKRIEEMIEAAFAECEPLLKPSMAAGLRTYWMARTREMRKYSFDVQSCRTGFEKRLYQLKTLFSGPGAVRTEVLRRLRGKPTWWMTAPERMRQWLKESGLEAIGNPAT